MAEQLMVRRVVYIQAEGTDVLLLCRRGGGPANEAKVPAWQTHEDASFVADPEADRRQAVSIAERLLLGGECRAGEGEPAEAHDGTDPMTGLARTDFFYQVSVTLPFGHPDRWAWPFLGGFGERRETGAVWFEPLPLLFSLPAGLGAGLALT
ncbi:hypothetical protein [Longispora albida]|uniref:hypothetical protein n=1 Tax=Longispora albida TaxID=203523 RepID=UPI00037D7C2F|nr:hypothetical protein [Longispora albida]